MSEEECAVCLALRSGCHLGLRVLLHVGCTASPDPRAPGEAWPAELQVHKVDMAQPSRSDSRAENCTERQVQGSLAPLPPASPSHQVPSAGLCRSVLTSWFLSSVSLLGSLGDTFVLFFLWCQAIRRALDTSVAEDRHSCKAQVRVSAAGLRAQAPRAQVRSLLVRVLGVRSRCWSLSSSGFP